MGPYIKITLLYITFNMPLLLTVFRQVDHAPSYEKDSMQGSSSVKSPVLTEEVCLSVKHL